MSSKTQDILSKMKRDYAELATAHKEAISDEVERIENSDETPEAKAFLRQSLINAESGTLDINSFLKQANKMNKDRKKPKNSNNGR